MGGTFHGGSGERAQVRGGLPIIPDPCHVLWMLDIFSEFKFASAATIGFLVIKWGPAGLSCKEITILECGSASIRTGGCTMG